MCEQCDGFREAFRSKYPEVFEKLTAALEEVKTLCEEHRYDESRLHEFDKGIDKVKNKYKLSETGILALTAVAMAELGIISRLNAQVAVALLGVKVFDNEYVIAEVHLN
jgi:hypothetical protein